MFRSLVIITAILGLLATWATCTQVDNNDLIISNAERRIDISSQIVKIQYQLTLLNNGHSKATRFLFVLPNGYYEKMVHFSAHLANDNEFLSWKSGDKVSNLIFELKKGIEVGQSVNVIVEVAFAHQLIPLPAAILQKENQLVQYKDSAYILSPYEISSQFTVIRLTSANVESYTDISPSFLSGTQVTYGPYENISPWTEKEIVVHYENNSPLLTVTSLSRNIEISHWSDVAVEDNIEIYHNGAKLKGPFARQESGPSRVNGFVSRLPGSARDVYYRDAIGNISTSELHRGDHGTDLMLFPRFPLYGGWKTNYIVGHKLPRSEYLRESSEGYVLQMKLIDHIFDNMVIDNAVIRISLPEGASNIKIGTPYNVAIMPLQFHYTFLDIAGGPVIELRASNLVDVHVRDFTIHYSFPSWKNYQKPYLCTALVFLFVTLYLHFTRDNQAEESDSNSPIIEDVLKKSNEEDLDETNQPLEVDNTRNNPQQIKTLRKKKQNGKSKFF